MQNHIYFEGIWFSPTGGTTSARGYRKLKKELKSFRRDPIGRMATKKYQ
jgi:hypothetical protein